MNKKQIISTSILAIIIFAIGYFVGDARAINRVNKQISAKVSNEQTNSKENKKTNDTDKKESQDDINKKTKAQAVKADFVTINGHEKENKDKPFFIIGEVTNIDDTNKVLPTFTVTTKEGNGLGVYDVLNFQKISINKGDKVKVYGKFNETKNSKGMIQISGNVIEKQ